MSIATLSLLFSVGAYAEDFTTKSEPLLVPNVNEIDNKEVIQDSKELPTPETAKSDDSIEQKQPVDNKAEAHSPISFLQGQLQLTPDQIEKTKTIFKKHYNSAKEEFSEILTPEQKERLEFLEQQNVQQTISL